MVTSDEPVLSGISNIHLEIGNGGGGTHVYIESCNQSS